MENRPMRSDGLPPLRPEKRLQRSAGDRMIFGVCGGLGDYFDIDPTLVRIAFIVATFFWGASVILYLVLALIVPRGNRPVVEPREMVRENVQDMRDEAEQMVDRIIGIFRR